MQLKIKLIKIQVPAEGDHSGFLLDITVEKHVFTSSVMSYSANFVNRLSGHSPKPSVQGDRGTNI